LSFFSSSGFFFFLSLKNDNYLVRPPLDTSSDISNFAIFPDLSGANSTEFILRLGLIGRAPSISGKEAEYIERICASLLMLPFFESAFSPVSAFLDIRRTSGVDIHRISPSKARPVKIAENRLSDGELVIPSLP
jgi:hypothetical protein